MPSGTDIRIKSFGMVDRHRNIIPAKICIAKDLDSQMRSFEFDSSMQFGYA